LLSLDLLIVVRELLLPFLFFLSRLRQLLLRVELVVFGLAQVFFSDPALTLFVCLRAHQVFELCVLVSQHLLHLAVGACQSVYFLLQLLTLVRLLLHRSLHLVDFLLALAHLLLSFAHFLIQVGNGALL